METYNIEAIWDEEAGVWSATSEDIPGLATEAETLEKLVQKLREMVPELLILNEIIDQHQVKAISMAIASQRQELVRIPN